MITRLHLQNFQVHADLALDLAPVTCVVGPTGSGKSSCVRALYWLAFNLPDGLHFLKKGTELCAVAATVDGKEVRRSKSKTLNVYEMDGTTYHALGRAGVPDAVAAHLNVSAVNFQKQADPYFWFAASASDVSRSLNALLDLALVDQSLGFVQTQLRSAQDDLRTAQESHRIAQEALESLNWLDPLPDALNALENVLERLQATCTEVEEMETMVREYGGLEAEWAAGEEWLEGVRGALAGLEGVYKRWQEAADRESRIRAWLAEWEALDGAPEVSLCPTCLRPNP